MPFQHHEHCGLAVAFPLLALLKALLAAVLTGAVLPGSLCCPHRSAKPPEPPRGLGRELQDKLQALPPKPRAVPGLPLALHRPFW